MSRGFTTAIFVPIVYFKVLHQLVDELQLGLRKPSFDQLINNEDKLSQSHKLTWQQIGSFWFHIMVSVIEFLNNIVLIYMCVTVRHSIVSSVCTLWPL